MLYISQSVDNLVWPNVITAHAKSQLLCDLSETFIQCAPYSKLVMCT